MTELLSELIAFLKDVSPAVWATLIKQVYVEAISMLAWAAALLIAYAVQIRVIVYGKRQVEKDRYSAWKEVTFVFYGTLIITATVAFGLVVGAIKWFANPEFYAIRFLLDRLGQ